MPSSRPAPPEGAGLALLETIRASGAAPYARPLIMGVVNATPDSFYAGGRSPTARDAVDTTLRMVQEGADIIDIGGQSTRPGSEPVSAREETGRVIPVVEAIARATRIPISIDTDKAEVARAGLAAGAKVLNDVSALRNDPGMIEVAKGFEAVILMHRGGESPKTMQVAPRYEDVVKEVKEFLIERRKAFAHAGGEASRVWIDVGIGFGKDQGHNLSLLKHIGEFSSLGPVVLGVSRKSFLGRIMAGAAGAIPGPEERLEATLAAACWAALSGVRVLRVHDVASTRRALEVLAAVGAAV